MIPLKRWSEFEDQEQWDASSVGTGITATTRKTGISEYSRSSRAIVTTGYNEARSRKSMGAHSSQPSREQLLAEIRRMLSSADLMTLTKKKIREDLSHHFGVDLKARKDEVNSIIDQVLQGQI